MDKSKTRIKPSRPFRSNPARDRISTSYPGCPIAFGDPKYLAHLLTSSCLPTLSANLSSLADPRFANIQSSPLYRLPSKRQTHVALDPRFAHMLRDERFLSRAKVDRYGRRLQPQTGRSKQDGKRGGKGKTGLERLYRVEDEEMDEGGQSEEGIDKDEEVRAELERVEREKGGKPYDPARDGGFSESSSDEEEGSSTDDEESTDEGEVEEEEEAEWGFGQNTESDVPAGTVTRRLGIVNLDWDNIRAVDLMAVFTSFAREQGGLGKVEKVVVYPSEFGRERMQKEDAEGPPKELFAMVPKRKEKADEESPDEFEGDSESENEDEDEDERIRKSMIKEDTGEEFSSAHLRRYQLERLRYYYAVLTCSTATLANHIYQNVDGTEYLSSANFFDLRFIPDEMDFSRDTPRDECESIPDKYRPNEFVTDALQHSRVKLTWDADDNKRKEAQKRAFGGSRREINENDLQAYLGSGSDSEGGSENEDVGRNGRSVEIVDATIATTTVSAEDNAAAASKQAAIAESEPKLSKKEAERQRMRSLLGLPAEPLPSRKSKADKSEQGPVGDMQITFTSGFSDPQNAGSGFVFENAPLPKQEHEETTVEKYIRKEKERKARRKEKAKVVRDGDAGEQEDTPEARRETVDDKAGEEGDGVAGDLGFADPFFTHAPNEATNKTKTNKERKEEKRRKREDREKEEKLREKEGEELRKIVYPDADGVNDASSSKLSVPASQDADDSLALREASDKKSKKKYKKLTRRQRLELEAKENNDGFEVDVQDPRFEAVFERAEYALDPSHPGFKGTDGMRMLLEEGRKRRRGKEEEEEEEGEREMVEDRVGKKGKRRR